MAASQPLPEPMPIDTFSPSFNFCQKSLIQFLKLYNRSHSVLNIDVSWDYCSKILHWAAFFGHVGVCELIMKQIDLKSPRDFLGRTPLHYAAKFGYVKVYEMIMKDVQNKNPMSNERVTPFHIAA